MNTSERTDSPYTWQQRQQRCVLVICLCIVLTALLLGVFLFGIYLPYDHMRGKEENRRILEDFSAFAPTEPPAPSFVLSLDDSLYFPTYTLNVEDCFGELATWNTVVTKDGIFFYRMEGKGQPRRFTVYQSDLHGEGVAEVFSKEGYFYNFSATYSCADTFFFSYNEVENRKETRCIMRYDIEAGELRTVARANSMSLSDAIDRYKKETRAFTVTHEADGFRLVGEGVTKTLPNDFWRGTVYEAAFQEHTVDRVRAFAVKDKVCLTVWFPYMTGDGHVLVAFLYDPFTEELTFLSCIHPYDHEGAMEFLLY